MIVFWNFNHFLVVEGVSRGKVYLNDPGMGPRSVSRDEFGKSFTGVCLEFKKGPAFKPGGAAPGILAKLGGRLKGFNAAIAFVVWVSLMLVIPGIIGFGLSLTGQGDLLILVAVFGATISYVLMMAAHITLRIRRPKMERPYRTPGGIFTSGLALVLACIAVVAGFLVDPRVVIGAAVIYAVLIAYFAFYSRHHLVAGTPEEEFAAIQKAEEALH